MCECGARRAGDGAEWRWRRRGSAHAAQKALARWRCKECGRRRGCSWARGATQGGGGAVARGRHKAARGVGDDEGEGVADGEDERADASGQKRVI
jgi:hypothetical protein